MRPEIATVRRRAAHSLGNVHRLVRSEAIAENANGINPSAVCLLIVYAAQLQQRLARCEDRYPLVALEGQ
jgi:hypothetical protein